MRWTDLHMQQAKAHHMVRVLLLFTAGVVAGCVNTESPDRQSERTDTVSSQQSVTTEAIVSTLDPACCAFQRAWQTRLFPDLTKKQQQATVGLDAPIRSGTSLDSRRIPLRNCAQRVNDGVSEYDREWRVLHGEVSALDREGRGWEVVADPYPGRANCVVAYFDDDLNLLVAWIGLEG
jgi:hypothetical protein